MKNEIILFEDQNVKLEVNLKDETVWLSLDQLAKLFERDKSVISRHIKNILNEELDDSVVAKIATTANDGKIYQIDYYNLDMIISVGYRVKSKKGIVFRKWANKVLKDYLLKGYAVNKRRLEYLEKTVKLIDIANRVDEELSGNEAREIIKVINNYSSALDLLDDYDHKKVNKPNGTKSNNIITYDNCKKIINDLKFNNNSNLFALERNEGLKSILSAIYQSYDGKDLYPSTEEKIANLLYMVVKNHVFIDGNKRIAAEVNPILDTLIKKDFDVK
ncbi:MAG: virulence RhuM family protein [Bacilli bacterium]|nr:virulence RhuM family protein [Bacilli bacterium]